MRKWVLIGLFAAMAVGVAHADVITLEEHISGDTPVIDLSTILSMWGTPGNSNGTSDQDFYTSGPNDDGTNDIVGLNIVNDTGATITSLSVYAYGVVEGSSFDYNCGVNNFFYDLHPFESD